MTINIDPNAAHAVYAPSSAHRWMHCTASAEAIAQLPEQESGEAAIAGTEAHEELERVLSGDEPNFDHPGAYIVALVVNYVKQLPPGKMWIEQRVALTEQIWGRCDVSHWDETTGTLTIIDMKNGFVDVPVEENEQLMIYAAGSIYTHNLPAKWIRLVVVQPNSFIPGVPKVKQWTTDADSLFAFATRAAAVPRGPKEFRASENCRYCPLFGRCDATRDLIAHLSIALQHTPEEVTPAQRAIFLTLKRPIEDWFKSAEKLWTADALKVGAPEGMKIVTATTRRTWKDEAAARRAVLEKFGPDALDVPTPAQVEKLGLDVSALTSSPDGGPVLAFASDKRRPFERKSVERMFGAVTNVSSS